MSKELTSEDEERNGKASADPDLSKVFGKIEDTGKRKFKRDEWIFKKM